MTAHLDSAASALQRILAARDPQHVWVVEIRESDRNDSRSGTPATLSKADV